MKSPLWIINSLLMIILIGVVAFIIYSIKNITQQPRIAPLKVMPKTEALTKEAVKPKDVHLIYEENDLFGTFRPAFIPEKPIETIPTLPMPPAPKPVVRPQPVPIQFLEPLPIKITGIIASSNEAKSQVSIMNNNTRKTDSYRVGDKLFDAYIIRIFPRKIIIIRSNGQQETLFLFPVDAHLEIKNLEEPSWQDVIQKQSEAVYLINPYEFANRIGSLAAFIEMVDLTTSFKNGQSVGLRVGRMDQKSVGYSLGLQPADVIIKVQNVEPISTKNRLDIYNKLVQANIGETIKVHIIRRGRPIAYEYILHNVSEPDILQPAITQDFLPALPMRTAAEMPQMNSEINTPDSNVHSDDWYIKELRKRDRQAMQTYGNKNAYVNMATQ